jgi:hypothetical protein
MNQKNKTNKRNNITNEKKNNYVKLYKNRSVILKNFGGICMMMIEQLIKAFFLLFLVNYTAKCFL